VAFLDHDDRLAPEALFYMAAVLRQNDSIDILYSDRDSLSLNNTRFLHLCKPDWSPETLLSGNYLFHLVVYRRSLLDALGGLRAETEGSQDYDLILRAAEKNPKIHHVSRILYHWRQHPESIAFAHNVKEYVYQAGSNCTYKAVYNVGGLCKRMKIRICGGEIIAFA
jgi:O-antigen biosynthesis protein